MHVSGAHPVAFHGRMHSYHWFTMTHPPCIPPTRASVGAFHAHEGDDGEEEGEEKEAVNIVCESGCLIATATLWKTYQWSTTPTGDQRKTTNGNQTTCRRPFLASI